MAVDPLFCEPLACQPSHLAAFTQPKGDKTSLMQSSLQVAGAVTQFQDAWSRQPGQGAEDPGFPLPEGDQPGHQVIRPGHGLVDKIKEKSQETRWEIKCRAHVPRPPDSGKRNWGFTTPLPQHNNSSRE